MALAVHVEPTPARNTETTAIRRVYEHCIADLGGGDVVADRVHVTRVLVAEHDGCRETRGLHEPIDGMQVGRAHARARDPDDDAPRRVGLRHGPLHELERAVILAEERGSHTEATTPAGFDPR
jgi:hypothetical protein